MCPNCILNQASLQTGMYVAFGICALFFIVGLLAMIWAFKNGEFENMEDSKQNLKNTKDCTKEGKKVSREGGDKFFALFRRVDSEAAAVVSGRDSNDRVVK